MTNEVPLVSDKMLLDSESSFQLCMKAIKNKKVKELEPELVYAAFKSVIESNDDNKVEAIDAMLAGGLDFNETVEECPQLSFLVSERITDPKLFDMLVLMKSHNVDMQESSDTHKSAQENLELKCPALLVALSYVDISHYNS